MRARGSAIYLRVGTLSSAQKVLACAHTTIAPLCTRTHDLIGQFLRGALVRSVAAYRVAIGINPDYAEVHSNLGNALREEGKLDEAIAAYRQAIGLNPAYAEAHCNLGTARKD
jgi:Flp pilus assembly protein TadD